MTHDDVMMGKGLCWNMNRAQQQNMIRPIPACSGFSFFLKCQVLQIALISSLSYQLLVAIILHQVPAHVNYWYKVRYGPETTCWRSMETAPTTHPKAPQIGREKEWNWKNMSGGLVVDANLVIHLSTPRGISTTPNHQPPARGIPLERIATSLCFVVSCCWKSNFKWSHVHFFSEWILLRSTPVVEMSTKLTRLQLVLCLGLTLTLLKLTSGYCSDQRKKSLPAEMLNFVMEHPANKYESWKI